MVIDVSDEPKLNKEMVKYEDETGKRAIWRGSVTEGYKKWKRGEKIYDTDRKGINILVEENTKLKWEKFAEQNDFPTISKLIRRAVENFIELNDNNQDFTNFSKISHDLKEPLTSIQGFLQLIIENETEHLNPKTLIKIKEIYSQSLTLENVINEIIDEAEPILAEYDVLIIEDDKATLMVLESYFEGKGYNCIGFESGLRAIEEINFVNPKLILLDIILPDLNGYEVCEKIKSNEKFRDIPVYYITAIPESEVAKKVKETQADGYFLKPFKLNHFNTILEFLK